MKSKKGKYATQINNATKKAVLECSQGVIMTCRFAIPQSPHVEVNRHCRRIIRCQSVANRGENMTNIILGMIAKISKMDAETKQLTARVEAQTLLLSAFLLTVSKEGGVVEMIEAVKKAINTAIELAESPLKSDAEILLNEFNEILSFAQLITNANAELDVQALKSLTSGDDHK